jgi:hypothetical protein
MERLAATGADKEVWTEMQRQLDAMNLKVQRESCRMPLS